MAEIAAKMHNPAKGMAGICLRGKPGWGEILAPLDTVINTFGGRWFDMTWKPQLTSPEVEKAVNFYVTTLQKYGEPGASSAGFYECATLFGQGDAAMWYDATSAVSVLEDPRPAATWSARSATPGPRSQDGRPPAGCTPGRWPSQATASTSRRPGSSSPG